MNVTFSWAGTSALLWNTCCNFYVIHTFQYILSTHCRTISDIDDVNMNVCKHFTPRNGGGEGREQISDGVPLLLPASRHWLRHSLQFPGRGLYQTPPTLPQLSTHSMRNIYILDSSMLYGSWFCHTIMSHRFCTYSNQFTF